MLRQQRFPDWETPSSPATRSQSVASDRTSVPRFPSLSSPPAARRPEPAYIVASAASQIVTSVQERDEFDLTAPDDGLWNGEPALVTPASLKLVNGFLDHLLYDFLGVARATTLGPVRTAVCEVLRPSLAREAVAGADQELQEYLGSGLEKELANSHEYGDAGSGWDLDAIWRRTRLRCMVYSSLGDMEEEDEGSIASADERPASATQMNGRGLEEPRMVTPAVAIFLASVLEHLGEHILLLAAQTAWQRLQSKKLETSAHEGGSVASESVGQLVLEEQDMEKVALNPAVGRLWRSWRKRLRSPSTSFSRSISRDSFLSRRSHVGFAGSSRRSSVDTMEASTVPHERSRPTSLMEVPEEDVAANIALPMSENDVEEIEVPGVAAMRDESRRQARRENSDGPRRRRSLTVLTGRTRQDAALDQLQPQQRSKSHGRSRSVPTSGGAHYSAGSEQSPDDMTFFTPLQSPDQSREPLHDAAATQQSDESSGREPSLAAETEERHVSEGSRYRSEEASVAKRVPQPHPHEGHMEDSSQPPHTARLAPGQGGEPSDHDMEQQGPAMQRAADPDDVQHRGLRTIMSLGSHRPMVPAAAAGNKEGVSDARHMTQSGQQPGSDRLAGPLPSTPFDAAGHVVSQGVHGEPPTDPEAIGVAHTSNVPMLAPLSIPPTRKRSGLTLVYPGHEASRSQAGPRQANRADHVSDGPQERARETAEGRQLRHPHDSQTPSLRPDAPGAADAHGEMLTRPARGSGIGRSSSPLNPLEELTEDFLDTSDEASSIAANQEAMRNEPAFASSGSLRAQSRESGSTRSSMASTGKKLSSGSRTSDRRQLASPTTASAGDRASVQRVFTPPVTPNDAAPTKPRRSDSFNGPGSPQLAQKLKGVLGRSQDEADHAARPGRTSVDDARSAAKQTQAPGKSRDTERSFEELIRSDATLQFTLTPPSMREMEASRPRPDHVPFWLLTVGQGTVRRADPSEAVNFSKKGGVVDKPPRHSSRPTVSWTDPMDPPKDSPKSATSTSAITPNSAGASSARAAESKDVVAKALSVSHLPPAPVNTRLGGPIARDARGDQASTQYFADFIRRTGPSMPNSTASSQARAFPTRNQSQSSRTGPLSSVGNLTSSSRKASTKASRTPRKDRPQVRDPVVYQREDTADLVDFIRQGPPDGKPSISKAIAPFRTTMDSDDFKSLTNGKSIEEAAMTRESTVSTQNGSSMSQAHSVPSSYNSQAKLLDDDAPPIQRKQRRVKDPYAIDSDDDYVEGDDELVPTTVAMKPPRAEESLMDFLNSVPPPSASAATPAALYPASALYGPSDMPGASKSNSSKTLLKREPSTAIRSRFGRSESKKMPKTLVPSSVSGKTATTTQPPGSSSSGIGPEPPQLPLQASGRDGSFLDMPPSLAGGGVSTNVMAGQPVASRIGSISGPARRLNQQPRSAHGDREDASALADFLRNSGPPVPPAPLPAAPPASSAAPARSKDEGGFAKIFNRKKKTTTTTTAAAATTGGTA